MIKRLDLPSADDVATGADLSGQTVVVTGATSGIGQETARVLAGVGARVVLAGRGADRLAASRTAVLAAVPAADVATVELDLTSLASVRAAAAQIRQDCDRLDILINNAGVMFTPLSRTAQGFELQIGVNHLGHFLFTRLLTPLLIAAAPSRVINVSSGGHRLGDVDLTDLLWQRRPYDKFEAYGASKTANVLFTVELDRRLRDRGVRSFAVHPGTVLTDISRYLDANDLAEMKRRAAALATADRPAPKQYYLQPDQGASSTVWAATGASLTDGGRYIANCEISDDVASFATDPVKAQQLWELSEELTA